MYLHYNMTMNFMLLPSHFDEFFRKVNLLNFSLKYFNDVFKLIFYATIVSGKPCIRTNFKILLICCSFDKLPLLLW